MKTIQRTLLASLVPLLTPMTALAQTGILTDRDSQADRGTQADRGSQANQRGSTQKRNGSSASWRASNVIGKDVKNAGSETIGNVKDLVVDMESGEIIAVIISTGGFLGLGESLSAVPVAVLRYDDQAEGFKTKLTKEQLGRAPNFKADAWPDYSDTTSSEALRSFRATLDNEGNSSQTATGNQDATTRNRGNTAQDVDNTARNKRAENRNKTPMDQGNSKQDVKMTKDIRSEITGTDMSANAKNIKIISRDESVTLNGVVKSHEEHQEILKIAAKHCEQGKITDNLTVKSN